MKLNDKQAIFRELFLFSPLSQKEIAERIGISEQTACKWVKKFNWQELKTAQTTRKDNLIRTTYQQIEEIQQKAIQEKRPQTSSETDQVLKLSKVIENLDKKISLPVIIQVLIEFETWLAKTDSEKCKEINLLHQEYLNTKVNE